MVVEEVIKMIVTKDVNLFVGFIEREKQKGNAIELMGSTNVARYPLSAFLLESG